METKPYQSNALHPDNLGLGRNRVYASLACSDPLRALRTSAAKPRGGEGLAKLALDCVFTNQIDFTEAIRSNYIHSLHGLVRV